MEIPLFCVLTFSLVLATAVAKRMLPLWLRLPSLGSAATLSLSLPSSNISRCSMSSLCRLGNFQNLGQYHLGGAPDLPESVQGDMQTDLRSFPLYTTPPTSLSGPSHSALSPPPNPLPSLASSDDPERLHHSANNESQSSSVQSSWAGTNTSLSGKNKSSNKKKLKSKSKKSSASAQPVMTPEEQVSTEPCTQEAYVPSDSNP